MDAGFVYGCLVPHPPILIPAVAGRRVEQVSQTRNAMSAVAADIRALAPDVVVLISPHASTSLYSMTIAAGSSFTGGFEDFGAAGVRLSIPADPELFKEIVRACDAFEVPLAKTGRPRDRHILDHGAAVPLFFLQEGGVQCRLVLLSFSGLSVEMHRRFGRAVAAATKAAGRRAVMMASGDQSHRLLPSAPGGYSPLGKKYDESIVASLRKGDYDAIFTIDAGLREEAGECGYRSLVVALGAMPEARAEVLSYEGPFGVGYLVARFVLEPVPEGSLRPDEAAEPISSRPADEVAAIELARLAVETFVRDGKVIAAPAVVEGLLAESAGVFVSLKLGGELRGCIGTFQPCEANVAAEIIRNAIASASRDPRFPPVSREELPFLTYSIDILSKAEPVEDISELDPKKYGVIVQAGSRKGLLLPDLEGVESVDVQIEIARRKAGIPPGTPARVQRFTVRRIK